MKHLIEISKIVTKKKVKKIEIFDEHSLKHKNSKFNEFYESLMANKFRTDRDASKFLYDCSPTDDKYRQLKSRFRKRLLNTLFFLDVNLPSSSGYDRAYFSVNKDWTLVKILLSNRAPFTAATLAKQILTIALKFKFADVIVNCSRILREHSVLDDDEKNFEIYDQHIKQFSNVLAAEIRSEELYQRVAMNYYKPASKNQNLEEKIDTYCDALVSLSEVYDSPVIVYNMYLVWAFRFEMLQDFPGVIEICQKGLNYIEERPEFYQQDKMLTFMMKKMSSYLHMRDFKTGNATAEKCHKIFSVGTEAWFEFMEYYFLLTMHTASYVNAIAIFNQVTTNNKFKKLRSIQREKWNVFEVWLNYIVKIYAEKNPILGKQKIRNFRLSRFLNDSILYPKDQRIYTVLMVIAQVLFHLEQNKYSEASEGIERLKGYANRQLKKEIFMRHVYFIRLLQQLPKADYKRNKLSEDQKYLSKLSEQKFYYRGLINELEVIPYEELWEIVLDRLA